VAGAAGMAQRCRNPRSRRRIAMRAHRGHVRINMRSIGVTRCTPRRHDGWKASRRASKSARLRLSPLEQSFGIACVSHSGIRVARIEGPDSIGTVLRSAPPHGGTHCARGRRFPDVGLNVRSKAVAALCVTPQCAQLPYDACEREHRQDHSGRHSAPIQTNLR